MGSARQALRWALPGWLFAVFLFTFELSYQFVRAVDRQVLSPSEARLADVISSIPAGEATALFLALGVPLGFLFAQFDAVQNSTAISPVTSGTPDYGWRVIRLLPSAEMADLAQAITRARYLRSTSLWSQPNEDDELIGERLPLLQGGLWTALGLVWVASRWAKRDRTQLHADLAEVSWLRATHDGEAPVARRTLDLADREKTLGACRVAVATAFIFGYLGNLALVASDPVILSILLAIAIGPAAIVAALAIHRRDNPLPIVAVLVVGAALIGLPLIMNRASQLDVALLGAVVLNVATLTLFGVLRWTGRREWMRTGFHLCAVGLVLLVAFWWIPVQDQPTRLLGVAYLVNLAVAFVAIRTMNVARRVIRERRLALQVVVVLQHLRDRSRAAT